MPSDLRIFDRASSPPTVAPAGGDKPARAGLNRISRPIAQREHADHAAIERLRTAVRRIEGGRMVAHDAPALALGVEAIDTHLPWGGLASGWLHEVVASDAGMASAFCALVCARLADDDGGTVLWCEGAQVLDAGMLHAPGLMRFGLDPARLIYARTGRDAETLWAMEEGLRTASIAVVVGAVLDASLTQTRRLQLAAEEHGVTALMLRPAGVGTTPSAAVTRWRIGPVPAAASRDGDGAPNAFTAGLAPLRWRMELFRCRGGIPGTWDVEWRDETRDLALVAPLCDRPAAPTQFGATG